MIRNKSVTSVAADAERSALARLLTRSLRCWRTARDRGEETQPSLFRVLDRSEDMLAPVMDSLFLFYEAALGRRAAIGRRERVSADESLLIEIVDHPEHCRGRLGCGAEQAEALDCALCSARIMLALAMRPAPERLH